MMRFLPHILLLAVMTLLGSSCQCVVLEQEVQPLECIWEATQSVSHSFERQEHTNQEGILPSAFSLCRTVLHPEERAETHAGERITSTVRGGGKAFTACRAPRSTIHQSLSGFVQRTTSPIHFFVSHTLLIYVLRRIVR